MDISHNPNDHKNHQSRTLWNPKNPKYHIKHPPQILQNPQSPKDHKIPKDHKNPKTTESCNTLSTNVKNSAYPPLSHHFYMSILNQCTCKTKKQQKKNSNTPLSLMCFCHNFFLPFIKLSLSHQTYKMQTKKKNPPRI